MTEAPRPNPEVTTGQWAKLRFDARECADQALLATHAFDMKDREYFGRSALLHLARAAESVGMKLVPAQDVNESKDNGKASLLST